MRPFLGDVNDNLKLRVNGVGSDTVNVSWDGKEFLKIGVGRIRVIADPSRESTPIADVVVNVTASKVSITTNLMPSTRYLIYVEEYPTAIKSYEIHYVTTLKRGSMSYLNLLLTIVILLF